MRFVIGKCQTDIDKLLILSPTAKKPESSPPGYSQKSPPIKKGFTKAPSPQHEPRGFSPERIPPERPSTSISENEVKSRILEVSFESLPPPSPTLP